MALVHDADSLIIELTLVSDPIWIDNAAISGPARRALGEQSRTGHWALRAAQCERVADAISGLRFLAQASPTATAV